MSQPPSLRLFCPAKINLTLAVGPGRSEDGRHPLVSWMATLAFGDTLDLKRSDTFEPSLSLQQRYAADAPRPEAISWPLDQDLAARAHRALEREVGRPLPAQAQLIKQVPTGSGLGGGSADAAGMLVGLDRLFDLRLDTATLCRLAGSFSSDAIFQTAALHAGMESALVQGLGDQLEPLPPRRLHLALLLPPFGCSTAEVYAAFDEFGPARMPKVDRLRRQIAAWAEPSPEGPSAPPPLPGNDLLAAACRVQPRLAELLKKISRQMGIALQMSGSGSALFVLCANESAAEEAATELQAATGYPAFATHTCPSV